MIVLSDYLFFSIEPSQYLLFYFRRPWGYKPQVWSKIQIEIYTDLIHNKIIGSSCNFGVSILRNNKQFIQYLLASTHQLLIPNWGFFIATHGKFSYTSIC
jgi:hypothetical protein